MSELTGSGVTRPRRKRADAERSVAAILDAAGRLLSQNPQASMEEVAGAAGLTRQTVYAHFPSRDALVSALTDRATDRVTTALRAADLDTGPAGEALLRLVQIGWDVFDSGALLLTSAPADAEREQERHQPIAATLHQVVRRGQRDGEFDPELPSSWIIAATVALGHAAGEEVRAGRMSSPEAATVLRHALQRLFTKRRRG